MVKQDQNPFSLASDSRLVTCQNMALWLELILLTFPVFSGLDQRGERANKPSQFNDGFHMFDLHELFLRTTSRDIVAKEMTGVLSKLKRTVGLLSILSMLVSSVAACACSHHSTEKADTGNSCHSHSESASQPHSGAISTNYGHAISDTLCSCNTVSPRLVLKQEKKQLDVKPVPERSSLKSPGVIATLVIVTVDNFGTVSFAPSYLRNSTSGRAPPRPNFA